MKTTKFLFLSLLASNILFSQQIECNLLFCGNLNSLKEVLSEGDRVAFGINMAQIEGFYVPNNSEVWKRWTNEQYGIYENVEIVRYLYDKKVNNKTLVIETFYNSNRGEFLFGRVLNRGDYKNMMNFLMKIYYPNARPEFNPDKKFSNNLRNKYYDNADALLKNLTDYVESL